MARDISAYTAEMCKLTLDAMQAFHALSMAASADGSVDRKTKELVTIGVTLRCGGRIAPCQGIQGSGAIRKEIAMAMRFRRS